MLVLSGNAKLIPAPAHSKIQVGEETSASPPSPYPGAPAMKMALGKILCSVLRLLELFTSTSALILRKHARLPLSLLSEFIPILKISGRRRHGFMLGCCSCGESLKGCHELNLPKMLFTA